MNMKLKLISWFCLVALIVTVGCKKKQQTQAEPNNIAQQQDTPAANDSKPTLSSIINRARTWGPSFTKWYGKQAPDFTITDIAGKKHTLSEYRGKNVMLIFWATWCPPCIMEIPHLVELRNTMDQDKLAMLAISYLDFRNTTEAVKKFVAARPQINYTVTATNVQTMPRPYNLVNSIPSTFFIAPDGKIKLVAEGLISISDAKAVIEAEQ